MGHFAAKKLGFPTDGFSKPYQMAIVIWTLITSLIGLWFTRNNLLKYFSDKSVALALLLLVLGTNYCIYASITSAMTHAWCFTLLSILIFATIRFYETAAWRYAILIGICIGWSALTRPTEILTALIPLFWGVFNIETLKERFAFFSKNNLKIISAIAITLAIGSIQLFYWKYRTGNWIFYSYTGETFSWLKPHISDVLLSYKQGWLTYTPMMIFSLIGFYFLFKNWKKIAPIALVFSLLFMYVAWAWDCWWYGGSLGQRTMVQCYAVLLFPFTAFFDWFLALFNEKNVLKKTILLPLIAVAIVLFSYVNLWFTHQAGKGGHFAAGEMTRGYYWAVLTHWDLKKDYIKALDTNEYCYNPSNERKLLYFNDFSAEEHSIVDGQNPKNKIIYIDSWIQDSKVFKLKKPDLKGMKWLRLSSTFGFTDQEWDIWKMAQMKLIFVKNGESIKFRALKVHRFYDHSKRVNLFFDAKITEKDFDEIHLSYWNGGSKTTLYIDDLKLEAF